MALLPSLVTEIPATPESAVKIAGEWAMRDFGALSSGVKPHPRNLRDMGFRGSTAPRTLPY